MRRYTGFVRFFDKPEQFGRIREEGSGKIVFFHFNDGRSTVKVGGRLEFIRISRPPREPKSGDILVFEYRETFTGTIKAAPWAFLPIVQTTKQMGGVVKSARLGDKLRVVFAKRNFAGDLPARLANVLTMIENGSLTATLADVDYLHSVVECEYWFGPREVLFTVCEAFDAKDFLSITANRGMLESIEPIVPR